MCIVVVDDEPELRELVRHVLEDEGYQVLAFAHPLPVTRVREREERPRLFLVDIMLPDMNGIVLAARLKDEGFAATPKIAMSASRQMIDQATASHLFDATLDKPFELDALLDTIERYVAM